jgi:3-phenylpropionate/trans-cinnamate dioxygenase ferredoxin reductase subunit
MQRRAHPGVWIAALVALAVVPLGLSTLVGSLPGEQGGMAWELGLGAGIVALSILVAAFALPSRLRVFTTHLGLENVLRAHRALALLAVAFVLLHLGFVVASDPKHLGILDLRHAPPRVWAASTATLALLLVVGLASTRRRRRPRYEGWRLVHVVLATAVLLGAALHVLWLHNLVDRVVRIPLVLARIAFVATLVRRRGDSRGIADGGERLDQGPQARRSGFRAGAVLLVEDWRIPVRV